MAKWPVEPVGGEEIIPNYEQGSVGGVVAGFAVGASGVLLWSWVKDADGDGLSPRHFFVCLRRDTEYIGEGEWRVWGKETHSTGTARMLAGAIMVCNKILWTWRRREWVLFRG